MFLSFQVTIFIQHFHNWQIPHNQIFCKKYIFVLRVTTGSTFLHCWCEYEVICRIKVFFVIFVTKVIFYIYILNILICLNVINIIHIFKQVFICSEQKIFFISYIFLHYIIFITDRYHTTDILQNSCLMNFHRKHCFSQTNKQTVHMKNEIQI